MVESLTLRILQILENTRDVSLDYLVFRLGGGSSDVEDRLAELTKRNVVIEELGRYNLASQSRDRRQAPVS